MRQGLPVLVVSICVLMLSGVALSAVSPASVPDAGTPPVVPRSTGTSPRVHVVEVFTGAWCPPCSVADPALSRMTDEFGPNMILLEYHCCQSAPNFDPYYDPAVYGVRRAFYVPGSFGVPTAIFNGGGSYSDGTLIKVGSTAGGAGPTYDDYRIKMDLADTSGNVAIVIAADLTPVSADLTVTLTATDPVPQTNLALRTVLYEDALYYVGTNNQPYHRYTARGLHEQPFAIAEGETVVASDSFTLDPTWNVNKLGVAAFVQSEDRISVVSAGYQFTISDILNAARYDFVPRSILAHGDLGIAAEYGEPFEKVLSQGSEHFGTWNALGLGDTGTRDERAVPSGPALAEAGVVIWHTGSESTDTLTAEERTFLTNFLDGGGNLLITGSNIGFEMWTSARTWYQSYLHATFEGDNTGATFVTGVAGDPVSNAFAATNLNILASPDRINAFGVDAAVPFEYPGPLPGAVRAQHDADSRVVYLGFQYFENAGDANRGEVMAAVLDWLDGAAPPAVDVLTPAGCELLVPGSVYEIRWRATDVRVPADGVDLYFASDYGPAPTWQPIALGEPNDGVYRWTVPNVLTETGRVRVVVRDANVASADGEAISGFDSVIASAGSAIPCEFTFGAGDLGMRLVSVPLILPQTSTADVLSSMDGGFRLVRTYDAADPSDSWKAFVPAKGGGDLAQIDHRTAFWIEVTQPGTLRVVGQRPTSPQVISLTPGWNLVGFPSFIVGYTVADLKAATGATQVEGFDPGGAPYYLQVLPDTYELRAWEGYWVDVPSAVAWTVPV